jgi:hypothetical protein
MTLEKGFSLGKKKSTREKNLAKGKSSPFQELC